MPRKRHSAEEIVAKLRQADVLLAQGQTGADVGLFPENVVDILEGLFEHGATPPINATLDNLSQKGIAT